MTDQPGSDKPAGGLGAPSSLRNLTFVTVVVTAVVVVGQGWAVPQEASRNLGVGAGWLVGGLLLLLGLALAWAAILQVTARFSKGKERQPGGNVELGVMFAVVILAGLTGAAAGRNLEWRLEWTAGVFVEGGPGAWAEAQALAGWVLATGLVVSTWAVVAQLLADRRKP